MESIPSGKYPNFTQSTTLLFILKITIVILSSYFLVCSGFIYTLLGEGRRGTFNNTIRSGRRLINNDKINEESPSTENELPLCVGKLLDKRHYRYESSSRLLMTKSGRSCRLLNYTAEKIIHCFDALRHQHDQADKTKTPFRLIFMGDSIVRQQYLNFVRLIPDYDILFSDAELMFHDDMEVTSASLGLRLSFRWQPYVDDDEVLNKVRQWTAEFTYDNTTRPSSLLLLSMALWHIIEVDHGDDRLYIKHLKELAPSLAQLSKVTRVIWLNQYPPLEFYSHYPMITPEKINIYNKAVRRILLPDTGSSRSSRVEIWDSGNPLVEEYVRSCAIHRRYEERMTSSKTSPGLLTLKYSGPYCNCMDHVHIGYSALSQITQLLYNDICSPISQME